MKCRYCENELPKYIHGNRRYCDEDCYYFKKLLRNNANYYNYFGFINELKKSENLLKQIYDHHGSNVVEANILRKTSFNWQIRTALVKKDSEIYTSLGNYSYILYSNKTLKIIKNDTSKF